MESNPRLFKAFKVESASGGGRPFHADTPQLDLPFWGALTDRQCGLQPGSWVALSILSHSVGKVTPGSPQPGGVAWISKDRLYSILEDDKRERDSKKEFHSLCWSYPTYLTGAGVQAQAAPLARGEGGDKGHGLEISNTGSCN